MRSNTAKLLIAGLLAVLLPILFSSPPALADSDQALARKLLAAGSILELETIVARAQAIRSGELLEAEFDHDDGHYVYEVEILDAMGQVWELKLDAATGRLLKQERDD
jgi:uncharacterized membrane protein YkoI